MADSGERTAERKAELDARGAWYDPACLTCNRICTVLYPGRTTAPYRPGNCEKILAAPKKARRRREGSRKGGGKI